MTAIADGLRDFLHAAGMNAVRAHQRALHLALEFSSDSLQIRTPGTLGLVVGVTDVVAD